MFKLCEKISEITKNPVAFNSISKGTLRYSVKIGEVSPFMRKLSKPDLEFFKRRATFSMNNMRKDKDERSVIIPLENPIEINGKTVMALRLKGIFPQANEKGEVLSYKDGSGYVPTLLKVAGENKIRSTTTRDVQDYFPWGTMGSEAIEKEVGAALLLGPEMTDLLLGFGIYEDLTFCGKPVGFAIYGMEREKDIRVLEYLKGYIETCGKLPDAGNQAIQTGQLLRQMNDLGLSHGYPHLWNYAKVSQDKAKILDLDTAVNWENIPKEERVANIFLSLSHTINDYMKCFIYKSEYDGEVEKEYVHLTRLLPFFLLGYFGNDSSSLFVKAVERFTEKDRSDKELRDAFGVLPTYCSQFVWETRGRAQTLIEPVIQLYKTIGSTVDLENFKNNPLSGLFYQAIEKTAQEI